jgi:hypothetical protein
MSIKRLKIVNERASGNRKGWTKLVTGIDKTKNGGFAFEGELLNEQEYDLNFGSVLVQKNPQGATKNGWYSGNVFVVGEDGLEEIRHPTRSNEFNWHKDFLSFRDFVASVMEEQRIKSSSEIVTKNGRGLCVVRVEVTVEALTEEDAGRIVMEKLETAGVTCRIVA